METMSTDEIMDAWWSIRRDDQVRRLRFLQEEYGLKDVRLAWLEKIEEIEHVCVPSLPLCVTCASLLPKSFGRTTKVSAPEMLDVWVLHDCRFLVI